MLQNILKRIGGTRVRVEMIPNGQCCLVVSRGLREAGLSEVEISDCPLRLKDVASNLVHQIALNGLHVPESLVAGKIIGGRFASPTQPLIESFRFVQSEEDSLRLRIVDLADSGTAFPNHLVATHLCAKAGTSRRDALRLLLVAVEVWPKEKTASNAVLGDYELNPHNFWSWIDLGTILSDTGRIDDAVLYWKTAVCMWPRGGKLYASRMVGRDPTGAVDSRLSRASRDFWLSVTNDAIRIWSAELGVDLPESALADGDPPH